MQWLGKIKGSSLIEVLIASTIFSVFVLQAIATCLRSYCTVRDCLETTQEVVKKESHYRKHKIKVERVSGISLIEIMIGLTLTLILTLTFIHAISIVNNVYVRHESLTRIQENARSIHTILQELYTRQDAIGCNRWGEDISVVIHPNVNKNVLAKKIEDLKLRRTPITESDVIWVNYTKKYKTLSEKPRWKPGTILVLSSCREAELFVLEEDQVFEEDFKNKRLSKLHSIIFYVAKTDRKNEKGEPVYALYSTDLNGRTQERIEGVEKIKVESTANSVKIQFLLTAQALKQWWTWEF